MTRTITAEDLRAFWREGREIALLDVREEGPFAEAHPLFAISVPISEIEIGLPRLVPRLTTPIVVYDDGEGYAERAAERGARLGYRDVVVLEGGLVAYARRGEIYRDVNVPSKAFGELVEAIHHTPSLPASEVKRILDTQDDAVVVDARRFEEFNTMSIPRGRSLPGGELVYRIDDVVPSPETLVIVNCAGRTRSIIGTQSLINAGLPNRVMALRNGTIGWTLEGLQLETCRTTRVDPPSPEARSRARERARRWAEHVGVPVITASELARFRAEAADRTLYTLDVRDPDEHAVGHPAGFISAPGGQLVQATDEWLGVRGARVVLHDDDGVRARMAASWLLQMGWDVHVLEEGALLSDAWRVPPGAVAPSRPAGSSVTAQELEALGEVAIVDLARSASYRKGHIPGAWFASGPALARDLARLPGTRPIVLTSPDGAVAACNLDEAKRAVAREVAYLEGGTGAWLAAGLPVETEGRWLSEPLDSYKRPYEGTDSQQANMQAYIDWELQLVAQLANDGVAGFHVVRAPQPTASRGA